MRYVTEDRRLHKCPGSPYKQVMRVLQVMAGAKTGGAEAFFERLVLALHDAGVLERAVIRNDGARLARLKAGGLAVEGAPFGGPFDFATGRVIRRVQLEFRPQITLAWMNRGASKTPHPRRVTGTGVLAARLGGYYNLKYYRHCDHLVGNTHGIVRWLKAQGWPDEKCHYLPNFAEAVKAAPIDRAALDTQADARVILAMGRLHTNKAFDVLIRAMAALPAAVLWLAGDGPERAALESLARELGVDRRVRFLGWRADVPALLSASDVLACPSRIEPLGNVIVEAFAHGVPVVAAASDGPRELIHDGANGLLVPIEDADALAKALGRVLASRDLAASLASGGAARHQAEFTREAVVAHYRAFFDRVAG